MLLYLNEDYDHILISGGRCTVDMVLNVMKELEINKPIGILPTGTANDFANALSLPFNVKESIENIINSSPKKIDIGKVNNKYFINVASAGMFTDVSQKINTEFKNSTFVLYKGRGLHLRGFNIVVHSDEVIYI